MDRRAHEQANETRLAIEQVVTEKGVEDQGDEAKNRNAADRITDLVIRRSDHGGHRDDRRISANRRSHRDQRRKPRRKTDCGADASHQKERRRDTDDDDRQGDQPDGSGRRETQTNSEQRDTDSKDLLQSQLESGFVDRRKADGVSQKQTE